MGGVRAEEEEEKESSEADELPLGEVERAGSES